MRRLLPLLGAAGILILALALRMPDLDRYTTGDESRWVQRASDFWVLLSRKGDAERTFIIGHPGVTAMWTALAGLGPERAEQRRFGARGTDVTRDEGYMEALVSMRRAFALASSLVVAALALLVWRLAGPGPALLAGVLLAADPFLLAHSQLVQLDASLAGYMAVSLLSATVYWRAGGKIGYLVLSGVTAGLAFLTKAPAVYLFGFIPLLAGTGLLTSGRWRSWRSLLRVGLELCAWAVLAVVVALLLWPAFSADPLRTLRRVVTFAADVGGAGHDNFFFGHPTDDPGWLYYPVVLAFRLGVGTLLGLVALAVWGRRPERKALMLTCAVYVLGFWLMMSLSAKKFDRYLLPLIPILGLLAGLGWWAAYQSMAPKRPRWLAPAAIGLVLAMQAVPALAVRPYYLAYYNPLLGGGPVAAHVMLVGWGEGLDQAAEYINGRPDGARARVGISDPLRDNLQALLDGTVVRRVGGATYAVDYISMRQRGEMPLALGQLHVLERSPEHSVWINGIEYVRIYRLGQPEL